MTSGDAAPGLDQRIEQLLEHLGLQTVHVASGYALDAVTVVRGVPARIASMTLVSPSRFFAEPCEGLADRVLFISGDRGPGADAVPSLLRDLPRARSLRLHDH